jgi:stress-induced morphogen
MEFEGWEAAGAEVQVWVVMLVQAFVPDEVGFGVEVVDDVAHHHHHHQYQGWGCLADCHYHVEVFDVWTHGQGG